MACRNRPEFVRGSSEVFLFCLSILSVDKTSEKVDRYLGNRESGNIKVYAPKFLSMTLVKVCPKFECNIFSDIDVQSAISLCSTENSRSYTALTDRLAFENFSSPELNKFGENACFFDKYAIKIIVRIKCKLPISLRLVRIWILTMCVM